MTNALTDAEDGNRRFAYRCIELRYIVSVLPRGWYASLDFTSSTAVGSDFCGWYVPLSRDAWGQYSIRLKVLAS